MRNKERLKRREMMAMPKRSTRSRMRKSSTLDHPETYEVEVVGEGGAVTVHVSAGEALAHVRPTWAHKAQLTKEPLRVLMHKVLLRQRSLPQPQRDSHLSNSNLLM